MRVQTLATIAQDARNALVELAKKDKDLQFLKETRSMNGFLSFVKFG